MEIRKRLQKQADVNQMYVRDWGPDGILVYVDTRQFIIICRIDPARDLVNSPLIEGYIAPHQVLGDGSLLLSAGAFYGESPHLPEGTTAAIRFHLSGHRKASIVFRLKHGLAMEAGGPGILCASRAMRFVIYGTDRSRHRGEEPWKVQIWLVDIPSHKKRLVLTNRLKYEGSEQELDMSAALSPNGRQFAYVPYEKPRHVIVKRLP